MRALRALLVASVVLVSTIAVLPGGAGASRSTSSSVVTHRVTSDERAGNYWTARRLANAKWMPLPKYSMEELKSLEPSDEPQGEPYLVEGTAPTSPASGSTNYLASRGPLPFLSQQIVDPSLEPFAAHGAVFFSDGLDQFGCSGTLVNSDNKSVVWTAAHCVYGGGAFFTNVVFIPGYEDGSAPFGQWEADVLHVMQSWKLEENPLKGNDFAAIQLKPNSGGVLAGDAVGMRGIAFNQQPIQFYQSYGYPAVPATLFDGEHLHSCESNGTGRIFPGLIAMGCNMKQGSSGGGWVMHSEYVSSNQSIGIIGYKGLGFGPYLGDDARALYDLARQGTAVFPQPTPTPTPGPDQLHEMKISLKLTKHIIAKGRVTAVSGHVGCTQLVPIQIFRFKGNGELAGVSKLIYTRNDGTFRLKMKDRKRAFFGAVAWDGSYDLSNHCDLAQSPIRRHRH